MSTIRDIVPALADHDQPLALAQPASLDDLVQQSAEFAKRSKAESTLSAYERDWQAFVDWCRAKGTVPLPASPAVVSAYATALVTERRKPAAMSTIRRYLVAIGQAHEASRKTNPCLSPEVRAVVKGIARTHGRPQVGKAAAVTADVAAMVEALPPDRLMTLRDRALLLVGFAGAFRRSELVALDVSDLTWSREGLVIMVRRSKTDQEGHGSDKTIPFGSKPTTCPIRTLQAWLEASGITEGPVWRSVNKGDRVQPGRLSDKAVALIVKRAAELAGLDARQYAGHSLRSGLCTSAGAAGVPERVIMRQTGHRSTKTLARYVRNGDRWRENPAAFVGL